MMGALNFSVNEARVPAGTVVFYLGAQVPSGWLALDGRRLKKADYPSLFAAIGTSAKTDGDYFYLPDARGLFLRGLDAYRYKKTEDTQISEGKTYYDQTGDPVPTPLTEEIADYYEREDGYDPGRELGTVQAATMATSYSSIGQHLTMFKNYDAGDMAQTQKVRMASSTTLKDMPVYRYDVAMRPFNLALQIMIKT